MKIRAFDKRISDGNCSRNPSKDGFVQAHVVDRSEIIKEITDTFISDEDHGFGVILGPTGSGKTFAIRQACFNSPKGALYFEIKGIHEFPRELAKAVGMKTERTIIGTFIGRFFPSWVQGYYTLPAEYDDCLDYVIRRLGERAEIFTMKYRHPPCLFIDSADLLAKHNKKLFVKLVNLAKGYANEGGLRLIFGCSEGHIIPLVLNSTSSNTRSKILEVVDLTEDEAIDYLVNWKLDRDFAIRLVNTVGSRMIFMERAIQFYIDLKPKCKTEEELFTSIVEKMKVMFTKRGLDSIILEMPRSEEVIKHLTTLDIDTGFNPEDFFDRYDDEEKQKAFRKTVEILIAGNALRYTRKGNITWHNKLIEKEVKQRYLKK